MPELNKTILLNSANLKGYWRLEGNSTDETANNYDGTDTDITYNSGNGKFGQGAGFNGSSSRISVGTTINPFGGDFTLGAWIKRGATGVSSPIFGKYGATGTDQWLKFYFDTDNALKVSFYADDTDSTATVTDTSIWHHVVFTYKYSTKVRTLYLDGAMVKTAAGSGNPNFGANALYIGALIFGAPIYFNGAIDDPFVTSSVLSADQIKELYEGRYLGELRPNQFGTTVGLWHLNGNSTDSSANGNNGSDTAITYSQANGKFGQGAGFNRSSSTIAIADNASLDFDGTTSFSISFWMKRNGIPATNVDHIINKYSGAASPGYYVRVETTTGYPYLVIYGASTSQTEVLGNKDVCDNLWHLITSVRSISADTAYLYIDGCLNNSATDATTGSSANANSLYLGSYNGSSLWYGGALEEVMITPTALTANQIRTMYALGVGKYY